MQMPEMDGAGLAEEIGRYRDARASPLLLADVAWILGGVRGGGVRRLADEADQAVTAVRHAHEHPRCDSSRRSGGGVPRRALRATGRACPSRILVAEDNVTNQQLALLVLQKLGYRAEVAANGLEAPKRSNGSPTTSCSWTCRCRRWTGWRPRAASTNDGRGATAARHRGDRQRHGGGARGSSGRGDGRLPQQADPSGRAGRRARAAAARTSPHSSGFGRPLIREGAQVPPEREPQGQPAIAGVLHPLALERLVETIGDDRSSSRRSSTRF